jgi:hypothetical protein
MAGRLEARGRKSLQVARPAPAPIATVTPRHVGMPYVVKIQRDSLRV